MPTNFVLVKAGSRWDILDGEKFVTRCKTKREALAEIASREKQADSEARLLAMDATGQYTFTPEQDTEINELATALRENRTRKTFSGEASIRDSSVREHQKDADLIKSWEYWDKGVGKNPITAGLRLRRFGRIEAFKRAGLESLLQN